MANGRERDRRREAYWRRTVGEQQGSGLTIRGFCHRRRLRESAFHFWRRELERRDAEQEQRQGPRKARTLRSRRTPRIPTFVPVRLSEPIPPVASGRIEIQLSGGRRVHLVAPVDRQALTEVLAVLEGRPC
jgi:hypothetical protein